MWQLPEHVSIGERQNFLLNAQLQLRDSRSPLCSAHLTFYPLRSAARPELAGGGAGPDLPTKRGPPITPTDFFFIFRRQGYSWFLISYRPLNKVFSYKIIKCIYFTDSHLLTWYLGSSHLRLRNDLYCDGWGVKLYSLTHSLPGLSPAKYGTAPLRDTIH